MLLETQIWFSRACKMWYICIHMCICMYITGSRRCTSLPIIISYVRKHTRISFARNRLENGTDTNTNDCICMYVHTRDWVGHINKFIHSLCGVCNRHSSRDETYVCMYVCITIGDQAGPLIQRRLPPVLWLY